MRIFEGRLVDSQATHALGPGAPRAEAEVRRSGDGWEVEVGGERQAVLQPRARSAPMRAAALGADTGAVLSEVGAAC